MGNLTRALAMKELNDELAIGGVPSWMEGLAKVLAAPFNVQDALKIPEVQQLLMVAQYCLRYHSHDSALPAILAIFDEAEEAACPKCRGFGKVWGATGNLRDVVCPECQGTGEK